MADPHVISALIRRYRLEMGALRKAEADVRSHREAMLHLEAVMRLFNADWTPDGVKAIRPRKPSRWDGRGEGLRTILDVLREAHEPITTHEIVLRCFVRHAMPEPDAATLRSAAGPVHKMLRDRIGVTAYPGKPKRWALEQ